jgi:hypothetical protein
MKFQIDDYITPIHNEGDDLNRINLTEGKQYRVIGLGNAGVPDEQLVRILDDTGSESFYHQDWFDKSINQSPLPDEASSDQSEPYIRIRFQGPEDDFSLELSQLKMAA